MIKKMKILWLVGMLALVGCSKGKERTPADPSKDTQVIEYAKQISDNREIVDTVLMGNYYTLPCPLKEFLNQGWKESEQNEPKIDSVELKPDTIIKLTFTNDQNSLEDFEANIDLYLMNDTLETTKINEETPVVGIIAQNFYLQSKDFVTKGGIALNAKMEDVNQTFKDIPSYTSDKYEGVIEDRNEIGIVTYTFHTKQKVVSKITLLSVDLYAHKSYIDPKQEEETIAANKKECEEESALYLPDHYDQLLQELKSGEYKDIPLYIEGTVTDYIDVGYGKLELVMGSAYVIKDRQDKEYVVKKSSIDHFVLNIGDSVQVWGSSHEVIQMEGNKELYFPYIDANIVNVNDSEIFNRYRSE